MISAASLIDTSDALARARVASPWLRFVLDREPELAGRLVAGELPQVAVDPALPVAQALRLARRRLALTVAIGDLVGAFDLTEVTARLSAFADVALDTAIHAAISERTPDAEPRGFAALALGKQGSCELNYSSDIDPILIFDPATLPTRPREDPIDAAVRIGRRVVELLQSRDGDGYVLRVDLRLRPSPEATTIALPVDAAISYYESQALPWERAAFIRARACAGDVTLGQRFLDTIRPFVWRRALDFGAIGEIRGISRRIRDHHVQGTDFGPGYNLKLGRGGIREVEFYAQIHQLIHGGRDASLRAPATRDALARLANAGWIGVAEARDLSDAYTLLRTIEHRLQMIDDRQTHSLPTGEALDRVAWLHGVGDGAALLDLLEPHVSRVGMIYDAIEPDETPHLPTEPAALEAALAAFADPANAARAVTHWRGAAYPALRSAAAQEALETTLPGLVAAFAGSADADHTLNRFDAMLAKLPSAINIFRLLAARPGLAQLLGAVLSNAPTLADALSGQSSLLDGLIDATALDPVGSVDVLADELRSAGAASYEALLDQVRRVVGEKKFALGTQIVAGAADPLDAAGGYARVAEAAILVLAEATVADFARLHGRVPDSELVVLALGRMGGGAMTDASDLDLIYLFTGDFAAESDGAKPLGAVLYYNRLAQRLSAALSVPTAAGKLYEVDTRLRPSGAQGPLVVSVEGFARYQRESAWTWEHMALTRARPIFGSPRARSEVAGVIAEVLAGARPDRNLRADAVAMRAEMAAHKPPRGPIDAKLAPGGLVDLEFVVHVAQLVHRAGFDPDLSGAIRALVTHGLLPASLADAHDLLTRLLVTLRLVAPDGAEPVATTRALVARAVGADNWDAAVARFDAARQDVAAAWAVVAEQRA